MSTPRLPLSVYAHGKLLLTGEYLVLDGAEALAVPTRFGQRFSCAPIMVPFEDPVSDHQWHAYDHKNNLWFKTGFRGHDWAEQLRRTDREAHPVRHRLLQLYHAAEALVPGCTHRPTRYIRISSYLEFDPAWGLGSSSTLVYFLGKLFGVDPYALLEKTFGGSGYDIAAAGAQDAICFKKAVTGPPTVRDISWRPAWTGQSVFVYRNQKQNSREGIANYRRRTTDVADVARATALTAALVETPHLRTAARLLQEHERFTGQIIGRQPVQDELFADFPGSIKSLGAWGGDFVWALSEEPVEKTTAYFNERGYPTVIPYEAMVV